MKEHAQYEKTREIQRNSQLDIEAKVARLQAPCARAQDYSRGREQPRTPVPLVAFKAEDEAQQVEREGREPQKWNRSDVLGDVIRNSKQHP